jgi:hypothetical protein
LRPSHVVSKGMVMYCSTWGALFGSTVVGAWSSCAWERDMVMWYVGYGLVVHGGMVKFYLGDMVM